MGILNLQAKFNLLIFPPKLAICFLHSSLPQKIATLLFQLLRAMTLDSFSFDHHSKFIIKSCVLYLQNISESNTSQWSVSKYWSRLPLTLAQIVL